MLKRNNFVRLNAFFSKKKKIFLAFISIIFIVGLLFNKFFHDNHQTDLSIENIFLRYENAMNIIRADHPQSSVIAEKFEEDNKNIYGALILLEETRRLVNKKDLEEAVTKLQYGLSMVKDDVIKELINFRLARIQLQQKRMSNTLRTLESIKTEELSPLIADLRGEILLNKGDKLDARSMWEAGLRESSSLLISEILQMKIDNLSF